MRFTTAFQCLVAGVAAVFLQCVAFGGTPAKPSSDRGVRITEQPDRLRIELNGQLFTEYYFKEVPRPYYYPLLGPGNLPMTRDWPIKEPPGEEHDHPHHRSLWYAHGEVNGKDFWTERSGSGKIVHVGFDEIKSGKDTGVIKSRNKWVAADGAVVCTDERTFRIYSLGQSASGNGAGTPGKKRLQSPKGMEQEPTLAKAGVSPSPASVSDARLFDFEITLHASNGDLVFGDTKEGTMAIRVAESMKLKGHAGTSHIVENSGARDEATWGKHAEWCDYYGLVAGKTVGIAMLDHPKNPRHPTWWHVRDYGLFAANPFGQHDFENLKDNKTAGELKVPAGKSITFRYRIYLHEGDERQAGVAEQYQQYVKSGLP